MGQPTIQDKSYSQILFPEAVSENCLLEDKKKFIDDSSDYKEEYWYGSESTYRKSFNANCRLTEDDWVDDKNEELFPNMYRPSSLSISGKTSCPYKDIGCTIDLREDENVSNHLRDEIYHHNVLLIKWIKNIESMMVSMTETKNQVLVHQNLEKIHKGIESIIANPLVGDTRTDEDNRIISEELRKELSNMNTKFCELAKLIWEMKVINDKQTKQLKETMDRHDKEIFQLKLGYESRIENIQKELNLATENSNKHEVEIRKLNEAIEKFHPETKELRPPPRSSLRMVGRVPNSCISGLDEPDRMDGESSLEWQIPGISKKIENHVEIWSKYFHSPDKRFTMRLWIHLNEINSRSQMSIELLTWNHRSNSSVRFQFKGYVTISIKDKTNPTHMRCISRHCRIEEPRYSELFVFEYSDLKKSGVLESDSVTVQCMVLNGQ